MTFNSAFEELDRANRICKAKHANKLRAPLFWCYRALGLQLFLDPRHGPAKVSRLTRPPGGMDAGRSAKRFNGKARVIGERGLARGKRSQDRLYPRILFEGLAAFDGLRHAEFSRGKNLNAERIEKIPEFAELPPIVRGDHEAIAAPYVKGHVRRGLEHSQLLQIDQFRDPFFGKFGHFRHALLRKRGLFGGRLHLDDQSLARENEVCIGLRLGVFGIIEVENRLAPVDTAGDCGDLIFQHAILDHVARAHPLKAIVQRNPRAGNRGGSRAAIRLKHVAVHHDLPFAKTVEIDHGAERPADQALDLLTASRLMPRSCFPARPLRGRARQHPVLRRYPAAALPFQPRRNALLHAGGAKDMRIAKLD